MSSTTIHTFLKLLLENTIKELFFWIVNIITKPIFCIDIHFLWKIGKCADINGKMQMLAFYSDDS